MDRSRAQEESQGTCRGDQQDQSQYIADTNHQASPGDAMDTDDAYPADSSPERDNFAADMEMGSDDQEIASYAASSRSNSQERGLHRNGPHPSPTKGPRAEMISKHEHPPAHAADVHNVVRILTNDAIANSIPWDSFQLSTITQIGGQIAPIPLKMPQIRLNRVDNALAKYNDPGKSAKR